MKIICDIKDSTEIIELFYKFDKDRERYISVEWIQLTKRTVSRRLSIGEPMRSIEVDCIKVRGKSLLGWSDSTNGTRYVYEGELLFTNLHQWMINKVKIVREKKLRELGL